MDRIKEGVTQQTDIAPEDIILSATHTHSGPSLDDRNENYIDYFINRTIASAVEAWQIRSPAKIGFGSTDIIGLGKKRAALNHGGVHPDPEVGILKIENPAGDLKGVFYNHGVHPATLNLHNLKLTEDWPHFASKGIKNNIEDDAVVGFFHGASGDINTGYSAELSAVGAFMYGARSFDYARRKGLIMTRAVLDILPSIETSGDLQINSAYKLVDFPRRTTYPYSYEEALQWQEEARKKLEKMKEVAAVSLTSSKEAQKWYEKSRELGKEGKINTKKQIGPRHLDQLKVDLWLAGQAVRMAKKIENLPNNPDPIQMPVQTIKLGDAVFVAFPNEVYSRIGLTIKKQSPFKNTFILSLAGGHSGYIPTAAEYFEGGYVANGTPFAPASEQILIDASLELINTVNK